MVSHAGVEKYGFASQKRRKNSVLRYKFHNELQNLRFDIFNKKIKNYSQTSKTIQKISGVAKKSAGAHLYRCIYLCKLGI